MRLELTRVGLLVELANHYTTKGAYVLLQWPVEQTKYRDKYNFETKKQKG